MTKLCSNAAVIGLGFGDEGKGTVVNWLAARRPESLIVRYSGGQQAGHTVMVGSVKHTFSNFGSGTLQGVPSYWSPFCTVDPVGVMNELKVLQSKGIKPKLYIDAKCPITTPWDKIKNQMADAANGTVGVGVGTTLVRELARYSLLAEDLAFDSFGGVFQTKLSMISNWYAGRHGINVTPGLVSQFYEAVSSMLKSGCVEVVQNGMPESDSYIYESSQGLLLDQDIGFFPHVTRASVGMKNVEALSRGKDATVYLVTRAFQTRHGNGPMTNMNRPHNIEPNPHEINVEHKYQGSFRRSLLDVDLLRYGLMKERIDPRHERVLMVTCMDLVKNELRFTLHGEVLHFTNPDAFCSRLAHEVGARDVFMSNSPYGEFTQVN